MMKPRLKAVFNRLFIPDRYRSCVEQRIAALASGNEHDTPLAAAEPALKADAAAGYGAAVSRRASRRGGPATPNPAPSAPIKPSSLATPGLPAHDSAAVTHLRADPMDVLFDARSYLETHSDLQQIKARNGDFDLRAHFREHGIREGRAPSFMFDVELVVALLSRGGRTAIRTSEIIPSFFELPVALRPVPNRWFSPWAFRKLAIDRFREIADLSDYALFEFYVQNVARHGLSPNGLFNEAAYLARYSDVARDVADGNLRSGFHHFISAGWKEHRMNLPGYGTVPHSAGTVAPETEFLLSGAAGLSRAVPWFDEVFYLTVYPDCHRLKRRGTIRSGLEHFMVSGFQEQLVPHPALHTALATRRSEDPWQAMTALTAGRLSATVSMQTAVQVQRAIIARLPDADPNIVADAIWPFVAPPAIDGHFDENAYLDVNPDLASAISARTLDDAERHYREIGLREQRIAPGSNLFSTRQLALADLVNWRSGINFFGPLSAPSGLGVAARGYVAAFEAAGIPVATYDISGLSRPGMPMALIAAEDLPWSINFFALNPDGVLPFVARYGTRIFDQRANVASWVWELSAPRPEWRAVLSAFDLITTPSEFCTSGFATFTDIPVRTVPYVVGQASARGGRDSANPWIVRLHAERAAGRRIILFVMDASSYVVRKGLDRFLALAASVEATHPGLCCFCVKRHSRDQSGIEAQTTVLGTDGMAVDGNGGRVLMIDAMFDPDDLLALKAMADVYVSPHRSEGFGLNIFESILLDVPVLCSRHGGVVDHLPNDYPYFIEGARTEISRDMGPYRRHAVWFEPSLHSARDRLLEMLARFPNPAFERARAAAAASLSPAAVGERLKRLLETHCALGAETVPAPLHRFAPLVAGGHTECFRLPVEDVPASADFLGPAHVRGCIAPFFTVVTPTYNSEPHWLHELHADLKRQSITSWEWCIADDGSTRPDTLQALRDIRRSDARVKVHFRAVQGGISATTNDAVSFAVGTFLVMVDHDDRVSPELLRTYHAALQDDEVTAIVYCDEDKVDEGGQHRDNYFKPDWSPEHLTSVMYVLHCLGIRKSAFLQLGGYRSAFDFAQDHDFVLRAASQKLPIRHIDKLLYHWRMSPGSAASSSAAKSPGIEAGRRAVQDHADRLGLTAFVEPGLLPGTYRIRPRIPLGRISVNILTGCTMQGEGRRQVTYVETLLRSLLAHDCGLDIELRVIVDAPRSGQAARLGALDPRVQVVTYDGGNTFNFSDKANFAVRSSSCERVVLLNDDMEALDRFWLPALMEMLELPGVGVVGGRLLYGDDAVQHSGIVLGVHGACTHIFGGMPRDYVGYNAFTHVIRNYSAVTGAMIAFRRSTFDLVSGFDTTYPIDYNDVDFCLRVIEQGLRVVYTPFACLRHHESRSAPRLAADALDTQRFLTQWGGRVARDPYYNSNLPRDNTLCAV